jgi:predicted molibdopterin-dependent oxidoreductase YjgC
VHLIETIIAGQAVLSEEELRSRYDSGWQISLVPEPGATSTFVAKKLVA